MNEQNDQGKRDVVDDDLFEEIEEEELLQLVEEEREKALKNKNTSEKRRTLPKWPFWLIAIVLCINIIAVIPNTFSIPAIEFLKTSAQLSTDPIIKEDKEAVVVVKAGKSKGTGFSITSDGYIVTNYHVIDNGEKVTITFPEDGQFQGEVVAEYEEIDLALLKARDVQGEPVEHIPYLPLAEQTSFEEGEAVHFIGNPLRFSGIANEGKVIGYTHLGDWQEEVFMLDAPIYHGNSGSPVINADGKVIGVIFATIDKNQYGKVGLAVPITYFHEHVEEIPNLHVP
ncbi:S1C family serine protease [Pontibacillus litoralis]|uniref:S7 family peptidase n=1 Tax=Pontibacillus litoralis JSM 072002 TaxID=1385512 RepID=A0A0A5G2N4_9BACI|nr:serine protease [Pontibacillus litoralis]KGX87351.1 S7 family peptidase [Pontibacillus litoralis JSM 072002]